MRSMSKEVLSEVPGQLGIQDEGFTKKEIRRNMTLLILMDAVVATGGPDIVIALAPLLVYLGATNTVIGVVQGATFAGLFGIILTPWISRRFRYKKWYMTAANIPFALALGALAFGILMSRRLGLTNSSLLVLVAVLMVTHQFFGGFGAVPHQEYIAGCIPTSHRGRLAGLSSSIGSLGAVGSAAVSGWMLLHYPKPMAFGYVFLMAYILYQTAYLFAIFARERPAPVENAPKAWSRGMIKGFWEDKAFFRLVVMCIFTCLTVGAVSSFVAVYGFRELRMSPASSALMAIIGHTIRIPSTALVGHLSDTLGPKRLLPYWPVGVLLSFLPVLIWHSPYAVYSSIGIWCLAGAIFNTLYLVLMFNLPKPENRAGDLTILLIVQSAVSMVGMVMVGGICDAVPYRVVFLGAAVFAVILIPITRWVVSAMSDVHTSCSANHRSPEP